MPISEVIQDLNNRKANYAKRHENPKYLNDYFKRRRTEEKNPVSKSNTGSTLLVIAAVITGLHLILEKDNTA